MAQKMQAAVVESFGKPLMFQEWDIRIMMESSLKIPKMG
jgi:hypothetical protein